MLLDQGGLREKEGERGALPKRRCFTAIGSSSVQTVADKNRHTAYDNKH